MSNDLQLRFQLEPHFSKPIQPSAVRMYFFDQALLCQNVGRENVWEVMMTRMSFRFLTLVPLVLAFSIVNTAFASDENETEFTGAVESLPNTAGFIGDWRVGGRTVHVGGATRIEQEDGPVAIGASVKVEGTTRSDNSIDAMEIEVKTGSGSDDGNDDRGPEFKGTIQSLPGTAGFIGDWKVGGRAIHVFSSTRINAEHGPVAVGAFVEIKGAVQADGSMDAAKIEVQSNIDGDDGRDELKGAIESLPPGPAFAGDWRVNGRAVHVTPATILNQEHGAFVLGALVEVKGTMRSDGSIDAARIEVQSGSSGSTEGERKNLKGTIQSLPSSSGLIGNWTVDNSTVHVTSSTKLNGEHGAFAIGTRVKVKGLLLSDGSIVATKVQVRD
jgi:hypothetical protein